jgi:radical SAM protein with 4Fe4S-binding SPASM domain
MNCNLSCKHCQVGDRLKHDNTHPSLDNVLDIIDKLTPDIASHIGFLGGEPLTYPYIHKVLERLLDAGLAVTISTNGLLIGKQLIEILRESSNWSIVISLDGPDRYSHEMIRGHGTFERTVNNIRFLTDSLDGADIKIGIACTLNSYNIRQMNAMYDLAVELGVNALQFARVAKKGNAAYHYDWLVVDEETLMNVTIDYFQQKGVNKNKDGPLVIFDFLSNLQKDLLNSRLGLELPVSVTGCSAAASSAAIDTEGRLWPCAPISYSNDEKVLSYFNFGDNSLLRNDFNDIWYSEGFDKLRELNSLRLHASLSEPCISCNYSNICTPCPLPYLTGTYSNQSHCTAWLRMLDPSYAIQKHRN